MKKILFFATIVALISNISCHSGKGEDTTINLPFQNPDLPIDQRVNDLVGRMTLEEKIGQMMNAAPAIPRLGIPEYNWWNECLHGVARAGIATVFPQAIGLGAAAFSVFRAQHATSTLSAERTAVNKPAEMLTMFWSPFLQGPD